MLSERCKHDLATTPHGRIEGSWKGKPISQISQEWPALMCRKILAGAEKAEGEKTCVSSVDIALFWSSKLTGV